MELKVKTEHNGKGFVLNRLKVIEIFRHFEGQEIELSVDKWKNNRTLQQNRWFHLMVRIIANTTGDSFEETKGELKKRYLEKMMLDEKGEPKVDENGEIRTYIKDTSALTIEEFCQLQSRCIEIAHFVGIPDEKMPGYEQEIK